MLREFLAQINNTDHNFMPSKEGKEFEVVIIEGLVACDCGGEG